MEEVLRNDRGWRERYEKTPSGLFSRAKGKLSTDFRRRQRVGAFPSVKTFLVLGKRIGHIEKSGSGKKGLSGERCSESLWCGAVKGGNKALRAHPGAQGGTQKQNFPR